MKRQWKFLASSFVVLVSVAMIAAPAGAVGPPLYKIFGDVNDAIGRPLEGVRVRDDAGTSITNAAGRYDRPQEGFAPATLTASRDDLVPQTVTVSPPLPLDTRQDFTMLYRIYAGATEFVTTASSAGSVTITVATWAPLPGTPGGAAGTSCVNVYDGRTLATGSATHVADNADGSHTWSIVLTLPQGTPEGPYDVVAAAVDCASSTPLTGPTGASYTVDNVGPTIGELSPADGQNTPFPSQPLQARVADVGPAGIGPGGIAFALQDETTGSSTSLPGSYDPGSRVATSPPAPLASGHEYRFIVSATDRAGNVSELGHRRFRGDGRVDDGGFRRIGVGSIASQVSIPPSECEVVGDALNRHAICRDAILHFAPTSVSLDGSRHGFGAGYSVQMASLVTAELSAEIAAGFHRRTSAYQADSAWAPRSLGLRFDVDSKSSLPATLATSGGEIPLGELTIPLDATWGASTATLSMESAPATHTDAESVPLTGACPAPLSRPVNLPCTTDPLLSLYQVKVGVGVDVRAVLADHRTRLGVDPKFVRRGVQGGNLSSQDELGMAGYYVAFIPPQAVAQIVADPAVVALEVSPPVEQWLLEDQETRARFGFQSDLSAVLERFRTAAGTYQRDEYGTLTEPERMEVEARRVEFQAEIASVESYVEAGDHRSEYGGTYVDNIQGRVIAQFTEADAEHRAALLGASEHPDRLMVASTNYSLDELAHYQEAAQSVIDDSSDPGLVALNALDVSENRVHIEATPLGPDLVDALTAAIPADALDLTARPAAHTWRFMNSRTGWPGQYQGGLLGIVTDYLTPPGEDIKIGYCTLGFPIEYDGTDRKGGLTAGHCSPYHGGVVDTGDGQLELGHVTNSTFHLPTNVTLDSDSAVFMLKPTLQGSYLIRAQGNDVRLVWTLAFPGDGQSLCASLGKRDTVDCGYVTYTNATYTIDDHKVSELTCAAEIGIDGGDSGSPVYVPWSDQYNGTFYAAAVGVMSLGLSDFWGDNPFDVSCYTPILNAVNAHPEVHLYMYSVNGSGGGLVFI